MVNRTGQKAFTLIELLVVISIIALLLAILMPSLSAVKKRSESIICRSNLKSIGLAAALYSQDYNGYVPRGANGNGNLWFVQFLPYVGNEH
ncbi:MAG: prepilin-type N-terminal cleavage/methylation domain-containing protein, partial [Anaerohalosphaera sp.]|nr:prepilin-type N-terminal cleavage/methylation domain-containing protein [Anaerohalosphaera sp.]